jgi:hypothetical protein
VITEKGERRRSALVAAAAELLRTGGFDAVRLRAVAGSGRRPHLAPLMRDLRTELDAQLAEILARAGRPQVPRG